MIHQHHSQTDRQTDVMRSQDHALHYSALRGKNVIRMQPIAQCGQSVRLCLLVITVSSAKTAELTEMLFNVDSGEPKE